MAAKSGLCWSWSETPRTGFLSYADFFCICENKDADQLRSNCAADQRLCFRNTDLSLVMRKTFFAYVKTKTQTSCAVTAQLISAFVTATRMVQSLYFLNPKFQASSFLLWLQSLVCVGPGRKPRGSGFFSTMLILSCRHRPRLTKLYYRCNENKGAYQLGLPRS